MTCQAWRYGAASKPGYQIRGRLAANINSTQEG